MSSSRENPPSASGHGAGLLSARDLPLRVPLIHGETTLSFLTRTGGANGLPVEQLLRALHRGRPRLSQGLAPGMTEAFLTSGAVQLLAGLVERPEEQLERALPHLAPEHRLEASTARLQLVLWPQGSGQRPLPACPLCMEAGAWLVAHGHRWRPCGCGRRWMAGDDGGYLIDTGPVPELSRALQRHRGLDHRLGPVGDALVSDAHQVTLWWWVHREVAHQTWREREDALGFARGRRRAAPVVVYPEAVQLAELMWEWEQRRTKPGASMKAWQTWVKRVAAELGIEDISGGREGTPLSYWAEQHHPAAKPPMGKGRSAAERRWACLPALHRPLGGDRGLFRITSCLRWVYGLPLTSTVEVCPRCGGRALSCRWVPAADCAGSPEAAEAR